VNPDFTDSWSDRLHRLPVVRVQCLLDAAQLETRQSSRESREWPKITLRAAEPDDSFCPASVTLYQYTSFCMVR
jgi:hypothetical protein